MSDAEQRYRLVVLGSGRVGKSSIIRRLLKDEFVEGYKATVEDLHCRDYDIDGTTIKVDILDTAGNLEFPADDDRGAGTRCPVRLTTGRRAAISATNGETEDRPCRWTRWRVTQTDHWSREIGE